ncbi:MAG: hypothetical protein GY842_26790 [bacterium]|nr:hypothetical protein [bacterium]
MCTRVNRWILGATVLAVVGWAGAGGAYAQIIPPGTDCFETTDGSTSVVFSSVALGAIPPIPADFFEPGSDPFEGTVALQGEPLGAYPGEVSVVLERTGPAPMPGPTLVPVEMVELSLRSVDPILVTNNMGGPDSFFDVYVTLSTMTPSTGNMTITETAPGIGGEYEFNSASGGGITVYPKFTFHPVAGGLDLELEDPLYGVQLESSMPNPWQYAEPATFCFPGNEFYPVPGEEVRGTLNGGGAGEHGVIPPRFVTGCCFPDGMCINVDADECIQMGGAPQGAMCTGTVEACCLPDGSCAMVDPLCCDDMGGAVVVGAVCAPQTEACCDDFQPFGCMDADPMCCEAVLGGWLPGQPNCLGDANINGTDDACEQQQEEGACCYGADYGSCTVTTQDYCENVLLGVYEGDGTLCEGVEACCLPDGTCVDVDALCCRNELGGIPGGPGSACTGVTVACCFSDGSCQDLDEECCNIFSGTPSPYGEPNCLGDANINGTDDACEEPQDLVPKWIQEPHGPGEGFDEASDLWIHDDIPTNKWEQLPDAEGIGYHAHDYNPAPDTIRLTLANDWLCGGGLVTDFHWWGVVEPNPGSGLAGFHLSIHDDDGSNCLPMVNARWEADIPISQITITDTGVNNSEGLRIYRYDYILQIPFDQVEGQRYWFDVCALSSNPQIPYLWKWQETRPIRLCPSAWKTEPPVPGLWTSFEDIDLAFRVTSTDPSQLEVNKVVADDFISDGRPIEAVRWWGSYFDERYDPYMGSLQPPHMVDGWIISFHHADPVQNPACPPDSQFDPSPTALGLYFAPASAVEIVPMNYDDCLDHPVYEYVVKIADCCLLCAEADPRNGAIPAEEWAFLEEQTFGYWLDIQAVVGATWLPDGDPPCELTYTGNVPSDITSNGHFWGWHTSYRELLEEACTGHIVDFNLNLGDCWDYSGWDKPLWKCPIPADPPLVNMAFELLTGIVRLYDCPPPLIPNITCPDSDVNCDGNVNALDIAIVVSGLNWFKPVNDPPQVGDASNPRADVDRLGSVNALDIAPIVSGLCWFASP